jgi:hypothetical protein
MMSTPKYELIEHPEGSKDHWCIKIKDGEYNGVVYQYNTVKVEEEESGDGAVLSFQTALIEKPDDLTLTKDKDESIMGAILVDLVSENFEHARANNENGTPDTEKFNHG